MGKSKSRIFNKNPDMKGYILKRKDAVERILSDIRNKKISDDTANLISLFGITHEELTEAGASYEELSAAGNLFRF